MLQVEVALEQAVTGSGARRYSGDPEELVVESIAFCVCDLVGLDTSQSSVPYLTGWSEQASVEVLEQTAALADRLARRIEDRLLAAEAIQQREADVQRVLKRHRAELGGRSADQQRARARLQHAVNAAGSLHPQPAPCDEMLARPNSLAEGYSSSALWCPAPDSHDLA